ncbi:hypothetical protein ACVGXT_14625, partial [Enterobacter intestinihominis]
NKVDDLTFGGQRRLAAPEVGNQPVDGLKAILPILLHHLKDKRRQQAGYVRTHPARRNPHTTKFLTNYYSNIIHQDNKTRIWISLLFF